MKNLDKPFHLIKNFISEDERKYLVNWGKNIIANDPNSCELSANGQRFLPKGKGFGFEFGATSWGMFAWRSKTGTKLIEEGPTEVKAFSLKIKEAFDIPDDDNVSYGIFMSFKDSDDDNPVVTKHADKFEKHRTNYHFNILLECDSGKQEVMNVGGVDYPPIECGDLYMINASKYEHYSLGRFNLRTTMLVMIYIPNKLIPDG